MPPLTVPNCSLTCHRLLTVFCAMGLLRFTSVAVSLLVRWPSHLDMKMSLTLLDLFVFGHVWFRSHSRASHARWGTRTQ